MEPKAKSRVPWIFWVIIASVVVVLGWSIYQNYFLKNYPIYIEAPCNPATNECYSRDCSGGACPPDNLSTYREFQVPASEFASCSDNSCLNICPSSTCPEILCSTQTDVACLGPGATSTPTSTSAPDVTSTSSTSTGQ